VVDFTQAPLPDHIAPSCWSISVRAATALQVLCFDALGCWPLQGTVAC
jgi:hypothetical protein